MANKVFAGPTSGGAAQPTFRSLVAADVSGLFGNLTDVGTDGIVVTGGSGAVLGAGTSLSQHVADTTHNGYLSSTDWNTFNGKQASGNYITALTGDVTASGPGSVAATLAATSNATLTTLSALTTASSLASVGTITTGVWSGTVISAAKGGTGGSSAASTGIAHVAAGVWSYSTIVNADVASNAAIATSKIALTAPTVQSFTSGSGTYTTPAGVLFIEVEMVGGGGGGGGGNTDGTAGSAGGNTTFGTSLLVANGGNGGQMGGGTSYSVGGTGGTASLGSGPVGIAVSGTGGMGGQSAATGINSLTGNGGASALGGAGRGNTTGGTGAANSGSGGAGGGSGATNISAGAGGAAGGYVRANITSPSATYAYAVGAAGTNGSGGTGSGNGGSGAAGVVVVWEYYQ